MSNRMLTSKSSLHANSGRLVHGGLLIIASLSLSLTTGCLNPAFVNQATGGSVAPLAPGDTPFVLIRVVNLSSFTVDVNFRYDAPAYFGYSAFFITGLEPNRGESGFIVPCPVNSIGLGNQSNPTDPAMTLTASDGDSSEVPTSAFPLEVFSGPDYSCGDTVVFTIADDRDSPYGIEVFPGRIEGTNHTGSFSGGDTFEIIQLLLFLNGRAPEPVN